jgi:hypothetical protein
MKDGLILAATCGTGRIFPITAWLVAKWHPLFTGLDRSRTHKSALLLPS